MTAMVLSALDAIRNANSPADYYKISMNLQRFATPADFVALVGNQTIAKGDFRDWLVKFHDFILLHSKEAIQSQIKRVSNSNFLFHNERSGKRILVIGFCGRGGILLLPIAVWLQYLLPEADVLVIDDPGHKGFTTGILNHSCSFHEMLERLSRDFSIDTYDEVRCFGTSGGGAAALAAGIVLDASKMVSICGRRPTYSSSYGRTQPALDMESILRSSPARKENAFAVFGDGDLKDRTNAQQLAAIMEITRVPVPNVDHHNAPHELHTKGTFSDLFRRTGLLSPV